MQKLPYLLVMGDKEMAAGTVAVRARGNTDLGVMTLEAFSQKLASDIASKQWFLLLFWALLHGVFSWFISDFLKDWTIATEFRDRRQREERKHRLNREIMAPEVRVSGPNNEAIGVLSLAEALRMAGELDVDLVEISPTAVPPVCRLMDYGKFKYQEQKKAAYKRAEEIAAKERLAPHKQAERLAISEEATGAIYQVTMDVTHPLGYGTEGIYYTLKNNSNRYAYLDHGVNAGIIKSAKAYRTGFIGYKIKEQMAESLVIGTERIGRGHVVYFADNPIFRGFWESGKLVLSNAIFMVGQ